MPNTFPVTHFFVEIHTMLSFSQQEKNWENGGRSKNLVKNDICPSHSAVVIDSNLGVGQKMLKGKNTRKKREEGDPEPSWAKKY